MKAYRFSNLGTSNLLLMDAPVDALGADGLEEIERGLEAHHHGKVRRAEIGEAIGLHRVIAPLARGDVYPQPLEQLFADVESAGALGRHQPLVRAGGVEVAAQVAQVEWN